MYKDGRPQHSIWAFFVTIMEIFTLKCAIISAKAKLLNLRWDSAVGFLKAELNKTIRCLNGQYSLCVLKNDK